MSDIIQQNWPVFVGVALLALLILVWLMGRASRASRLGQRRREYRPDVLDEGAAPAARNQALIDSPMAATIVPAVTVDPRGGLGEAAAAPVETMAAGNAEAEQWEAAERADVAPDAATPDVTVPDAAPSDRAAGAPQDDLGRLKGVGPKLVALLRTLGVTRYEQIAGWSEADIDRVDAQLGPFQGRIRRDDWVEQARLLDSDTGAYEARFGKL